MIEGRSHSSIATQFGIGRSGVQRHFANHMSGPALAERLKKGAARARKRLQDTVTAVVGSVEVPEVRSPEAVQAYNERLLGVLAAQRIVAESKGDARLVLAILKTESEINDKIARNMGVWREGTTINIDGSQRKLELLVKDLSAEDLRRYLASGVPAPDGAGVS